MELNIEQEKVIKSHHRFLFLLAGAGSGKTRVIVEKIRRLLEEGVSPNHILAITFTRKSAQEMIERVKYPDVHIHTFHQLCLKRLKTYSTYNYDIVNENDIPYTKEELLKISKHKNSLYRTTKPKAYNRYQEYLKSQHKKDFDDLLIDFKRLVDHHHYTPNYHYIFVDEFQDTNLLQYEVLKKLIKPYTKVLAVGDPDQSIYQFRGAHSKIISYYVKDYQAELFTLTMNYRSTPEIIDVANKLIKRNNRTYKKELKTNQTAYVPPLSISFIDQTDEAHYLINDIKRHQALGIKLHEIAILYRNHFRAYELKHHMDLVDFPYQESDSYHQNHIIHMMTIHQAKGLEFEVVYIIGLEQRLLPSAFDFTLSELDEERRLMFVAMTRAKKYLYLTHVKCNSFNILQKPSLFIKECGLKHQKIK